VATQHWITQSMINGYIRCALWTCDGPDGTPLDTNAAPSDLIAETYTILRRDFEAFFAKVVAADLDWTREFTASEMGHNFWLTRNRHGDGFWSDGTELGARLTEIAHTFPEVTLYVGDNGLIFQCQA